MMAKHWRRVLTVATFALLIGGCASDPDAGGGVASVSGTSQPTVQQSSDGKSDDDKNREFARCMREQGLDVPDPEPGQRGVTVKELNPEKAKPAQEACRHLLPNGGAPERTDPEQLDRAREQAKCLREHGIDVPDPDPNNPGIRPPEGVDREKMRAAMEACRQPGGPADGPKRTSANG